MSFFGFGLDFFSGFFENGVYLLFSRYFYIFNVGKPATYIEKDLILCSRTIWKIEGTCWLNNYRKSIQSVNV